MKDDWSIEINVGQENPPKVEVFQVLEDGTKTPLVAGETKEFQLSPHGEGSQSSGQGCFASGGAYFTGLARIIASIIESCA